MRLKGNVGTGIGFPAILVNVADSDNDGVVCEVAPPTPTPDPTPDPTPAPTPQFNYETCEAADAAGEIRVRGRVGEGLGFPAWMVNASDDDGDGVVCEVAPPDPTPTPGPTPQPTPDPTPDPTPVMTGRPVPTQLPPGPAVSPPPFPNTFQGSVTIDGQPAEDGIEIYAEIVEGTVIYATHSVLTSGGNYSLLQVGPPSQQFHNDTITFYAWIDGAGVAAAEMATFKANISLLDPIIVQDLTFTTSGS